jgi:uncharacterized protein GlcG (DUF336 family)
MKKITLLFVALTASVTTLAQTPPATAIPPQPPAARGPALDIALEAAHAAIDACTSQGQKGAASVVDSAGILKVLLASDGTSVRGVTSSTSKALTALTFKVATIQLTEQIKTDKTLAEKIAANPAYNARPGGVLLTVDGEIIGALGVGGARTDDACAVAGLEKVKGRLK